MIATDHRRDADCTLGPDFCCIGCGVDHSNEPCRDCGGRGHHLMPDVEGEWPCGELDRAAVQLTRYADVAQQAELGGAIAELRRLLHGDSAPPAFTRAAPNVKHLVAVGKSGPIFGARGEVQYVVGRRGLRSGALDLPRSTADEFAAAEDLPASGPEQLQDGEEAK